MSNFTIHTKETAKPESAQLLAEAEKAFGFIPNLLGVFAESPAALKAYLTLGKVFDESAFSATERQLVILTASRFNECTYCIAAHSVVAGMQNVPADVIESVRNDQPIADSKLEALRQFTTAVVEKRGHVSDEDSKAFFNAGYSNEQVLAVILGVTFKTLSNYTNHIAETPLDSAFASKSWSPAKVRKAS